MNELSLIIIIILAFLCTVLAVLFFVIKANIREITKELKKTRDADYDRQLRVTLNDRDMEELAKELNLNLDHQKELKLKEESAKKQLEQSVSDIAHDLRTPLTVVKGNLQMLASEKLSDEGRQYLEVSSRKAETLKNMVDEFFELSVLESDAQMPELKRIDIVEFLVQFIIDHESMIRDKGLTPDIDLPDKSVFIEANEELMVRVFSNLLANICKYAKESFRISVSAEERKVILSNRIVSHDEIDTTHIFDRTYRADKARREGSAGLGLYIAKLLMEKQKGNIIADISDGEIHFILSFIPPGQ